MLQNLRLQINSIQDPFQGAFAELDTANFDFVFLTKSQGKCVSGPLHEQRDSGNPRSVCLIVYYTASLSI